MQKKVEREWHSEGEGKEVKGETSGPNEYV